MKLAGNSIEMTCTLVLTEREIKMLAWLAGYGGDTITKAITEKITKEYPADEWNRLWSEMRSQLESSTEHLQNVRDVFRGTKVATHPGDKGNG